MSGLGKESKAEKDRQKAIQDRCQAILTQLLRDEDNKYCVDCDAKGPRWASWNLGVFLCIRCAGIHRNLGVHISKVKSVNLDTWTPQQVVTLQQMGNSRARAIYEANLPDTWRRPQTDTSLEAFIRAKYQTKRYIAKEWVPPPMPEVDWDKDIEEEAERLRKRKKEKNIATIPPVRKPIADNTVPPLPKPTNSPKTSRASGVAAAAEPVKTSAIDLLGLSTVTPSVEPLPSNGAADDSFSSFLSAPTAPASTPVSALVAEQSDVKGLSTEEESFFNQAVEAKKPLSKDSIMALYTNQQQTPQRQTYHAPGMYAANPMYPAANAMFSNGMNPSVPVQQLPAALAANPFFGMSSNSVMPQQHGIPLQHDSNNPPKPSDDLLGDFGNLNLSSTNPSLSQQMSGMSLNPQAQFGGMAPNFPAMANSFPVNNFANPPQQPPLGQTFTTHLWQ